jgi:hypothetical protein
MQRYLQLMAIFLVMLSSQASAQIYKSVDTDGRVTYSNIKTKGASRLEQYLDANDYVNDEAKKPQNSISNKRRTTPENFPRVDKEQQSQRDGKRRDILNKELDAEIAALEQAKKAYIAGESKPEAFKAANGQTFRNVAKFDEKMKGLQEDVDSHQNNIMLLQEELDGLR